MSFSFGIRLKDVRDPVAHAKSTVGTKEKPKLIFTIRSLRNLMNKQKELDSFEVVEKMRLWTTQSKEKLSQVTHRIQGQNYSPIYGNRA